MVAFVLAAGLGTRLRPLTNHVPKALVEAAGEPLLEHVIRRCLAAGATRLVVNVSHLGEQVTAYLAGRDYGVPVAISEEPDGPLETGGGLKKAAPLFPANEPVLIHNADILTDVDLRALLDAHEVEGALATLAVSEAVSGRHLVFDDAGLAGYAIEGEERLMREPQGPLRRFDFCGVHVVSPALIDLVRQDPAEKFSIMDTYLRLAKGGGAIRPFAGGGRHRCLDVGTHERLAEAEAWLAETGG